jgi:hypothetical protein
LVLVTLVLAILAGMVLLLLWRAVWTIDESTPHARIFGMYSPILTWLKYRRLPAFIRRSGAAPSRMLFAPGQPQSTPASPTGSPMTKKKATASLPKSLPTSLPKSRKRRGEDAAALKHQLEEMQYRVSSMEAELNRLRPVPWYRRWNFALLLAPVLALILGGIPAYLVVQHRWLDFEDIAKVFQESWSRSGFLTQISLPSYFLAVFACCIGLLIVMWVQRRGVEEFRTVGGGASAEAGPPMEENPVLRRIGKVFIWASIAGFLLVAFFGILRRIFPSGDQIQIPGWDLILVLAAFFSGWVLKDGILLRALAWVRANLEYLLALALGHLALIAVLASYYSAPQFLWAAVLLLAVAAINLIRFIRRIHPMYWIVSLAIFVFSYDLASWWTSTVGDEFTGLDLGRYYGQIASVSVLAEKLFSAQGAYGIVPAFTSYVQGFFMRFLGSDIFGWRFGNPYLCAIAVALFYYFFRTFVSRRTALVAALLMAASEYIMSFGRIGYANIHSLFAMCLVLGAAAWALRTGRMLAYAAVGASIAFCFYIYPGALYAVPLPLLLLLLYAPPVNRQALQRWGLLVLTCLMIIFPLFLQPAYWVEKLPGTFYANPEILATSTSAVFHVESNLLYSFFSYLYIVQESHFIAVSYLDPVSGILFIVGFFLLVTKSIRRRFSLFLLLGFAELLLLVGTSHASPCPPNTRMYLLIPWFVMFAAFGLVWLAENAVQSGLWQPKHGLTIGIILFAAIFGLNLYQSQGLAYKLYVPREVFEAIFVRLTEHAHSLEPDVPKNYVVILDANWSVDGLLRYPSIYPLFLSQARISQVRIDGPTLPEESKPLLSDRNTLVVLPPWLDANWQTGLEAPLRELGKQPCAYPTSSGKPRFILYTHPDLAAACQ